MQSSNASAANYCFSTLLTQAREEADAAFKRAIEIAVAQGAKMLELRASTARARLWAERGEHQRAFDMLSPVYDWFTEGFETPDLRLAKTLLGELRTLSERSR